MKEINVHIDNSGVCFDTNPIDSNQFCTSDALVFFVVVVVVCSPHSSVVYDGNWDGSWIVLIKQRL